MRATVREQLSPPLHGTVQVFVVNKRENLEAEKKTKKLDWMWLGLSICERSETSKRQRIEHSEGARG